ncbi:hypothetical protein Droror1_Dr00015268, partial [Drosera rotundifolia]
MKNDRRTKTNSPPLPEYIEWGNGRRAQGASAWPNTMKTDPRPHWKAMTSLSPFFSKLCTNIE